MMYTIRRGEGDRPAKEMIDDPFINGVESASARGRYEIDFSELKPISLEIALNLNLKKGQIIAIDSEFNMIYGIISSVEYRFSDGKASMNLEVLRK